MTDLVEPVFFAWSLASGVLLAWQTIRWWRWPYFLTPLKPILPPFGLIDFLVAYFLITALAIVTQGIQPQTLQITVKLIGELLLATTILVALTIRYRDVSDLFRPPVRKRWTKHLALKIAAGLLAAFIFIPPILRIHQFASAWVAPYSHPTLDSIQNDPSPWLSLTLAFRAAVNAPILEEILYRGLLQGALLRLCSGRASTPEKFLLGELATTTATLQDKTNAPQTNASAPSMPGVKWFQVAGPIVASSALFALAHLGLGASPIPLFFFGLVLGALHYRTGSLLSCIVLHSALNAYSLGLEALLKP